MSTQGVDIQRVVELPEGSAIATLGNLFVKQRDNVWLCAKSVDSCVVFDNEEISDYGVVVAFDATHQRRHIGDFFVPELDYI